MGSTGHGLFNRSRDGAGGDDTFGIAHAIVYKGKIPTESGMQPVGANKITLKIPVSQKTNILFQFKLSKDSKLMTIIGYKDSVPTMRAKVSVDAQKPSIDKVIQNGDSKERQQALKLKDLMNKSTTVDESKLPSIAQKLLRKKMGGK